MAEQTLNPSILKDTREAKGLTLEIVHEATKIPMDVLKAIEQGYTVRILSPFYFRGFVKIYAEFLGLDIQEVFKAYNLEKTSPRIVTPEPRPAAVKATAQAARAEAKMAPRVAAMKEKAAQLLNNMQARRQAAKPKTPWISRPNPAFEQIREIFKGLLAPANRQVLGRTLGFILVLFLLFKLAGCVAGHLKTPHKSKSTVVLKTTAVKESKETKTAKENKETKKEKPHSEAEGVTEPAPAPSEPAAKTTASVAAPVETVKAPSQNRKVEVVLRAMRDSWIQVKSDDKVVFAMTMQKGTMETWSAKDKIEISGKNLGEFQWEVNGKELSALSSSERRAKRIEITKDGLSVKK